MDLISNQHAESRFVAAVLVVCSVVSVLLSLWCIHIDHVINNDGIEYIRAAGRLADSDWAGAIAVYRWPFYPLLMLVVSKIAGVSYLVSGHILNTLFFTGAVVLFVLTVRVFGGDSKRLTVLAAFVALTHPAFNEYRAFIIRDAGYLVCFLGALYLLGRYRMFGDVYNGLGAILALLVATLFRIEGLIFLLCSPILFSVLRPKPLGLRWSVLMVMVFAGAALLLVVAWWLLIPNVSVNHLSVLDQPLQVLTTAWHQISESIGQKLTILRTEFLGQYSSKFDVYLLFGFRVFMIVVTATLSQLTVPWGILFVYGAIGRHLFWDSGLDRLWLSVIAMHLFILAIFASIMLFLAPRYPLALCMTVLLIAPFVLEKLFFPLNWRELSIVRRSAVILLLLWGVGESISGLDNATRAESVKASGVWLAQHAVETGSLVTNDRLIAFYSNRYLDPDLIISDYRLILWGLANERWPRTKFIALRFQRGQEKSKEQLEESREQLKALGATLVENFSQPSGDTVIVYRLP